MRDLKGICRVAAWAILAIMTVSPASAAEFDFPDIDTFDGRPPNFVVVPGIRLAMRRQIDADTSVESYVLTQLGLAGRPFVIGASGFSGGISISRNFGDISWSGTMEATPSWDGLFNSYSSTGLEFQTQLSRSYVFEGTPWSISPRIMLAYRFSTDSEKERSKVQIALPLYYRINPQLDLVFVSRIDHRHVPHWTTTRNDVVANVSVGARYEIRKGMQVSAFLAYENRWSSAPEVRYSRWLIVPQLGLRADF
ncbi:hypothetical protein [Phreatobacter stygius]|uniref:DUF2490 domain-containing protein n=1 Tax=Phreatobacter stygius TaxID=1940610 RepID=A0A4D7BFK3_9HYPH|nr:hypothetical protein [Phreatobacter stygius]QCI68638.1 hypothetical protein E8M01_33055 [Phreatobacter stygius]